MNARIATIVLCLVCFCFPARGLHAGQPPVAATPDCATCHVSATPTEGDAALKACPRPIEETAASGDPNEVDDFLLLDQLSDIYVPVVFPHKLHASMGEMGEGCTICHHRNPEGPILKCSECHGGPSNPVNLKQPGLKGAYHRQCLGCHREWTHETDCAVCHAKREPGVQPKLPLDPTDIMGMLHPNIEVPDEKVFEIEDEMMSDAKFVTFHHKQHVDLFGYKCVDCHQQENCSACHDTGHKTPRIKEDPHQDCMKCHQPQIENDCTHCHDAQVRTEGFDHAITGIPFGFLHTDASCVDCHTEGIRGPSSCTNCHDDGRTHETVEEIP